jgi:hypothetical protein
LRKISEICKQKLNSFPRVRIREQCRTINLWRLRMMMFLEENSSTILLPPNRIF